MSKLHHFSIVGNKCTVMIDNEQAGQLLCYEGEKNKLVNSTDSANSIDSIDSTDSYNGKYYEYYQNGAKMLEIETDISFDDLKDFIDYQRFKYFDVTYHFPKPEGKTIKWFDNGDVQLEFESHGGKLHGKHIEWTKYRTYESRSVFKDILTQKIESNYVDGKLHGKYITWKAVEDNFSVAWIKQQEYNYENGIRAVDPVSYTSDTSTEALYTKQQSTDSDALAGLTEPIELNCHMLQKIKDCYPHFFTNSTQLVFKSCADCIVVLEKTPNTITNEHRFELCDDLYDQKYAKYRGSEFMVVLIFKKSNPSCTIEKIKNTSYRDTIEYVTGTLVKVENFDKSTVICAPGIHYFKSITCAFFFQLDQITEFHEQFTGIVVTRTNNGLVSSTLSYACGALHGPGNYYDYSGKLFYTRIYGDTTSKDTSLSPSQ